MAAYYIGINSASTVMGTDICAEIHENILEILIMWVNYINGRPLV